MSAKASFYELAKSRITIRKRELHEAFDREIRGPYKRCAPAFAIMQQTTRGRTHIERWIEALEISVDETYFDEKNVDLM